MVRGSNCLNDCDVQRPLQEHAIDRTAARRAREVPRRSSRIPHQILIRIVLAGLITTVITDGQARAQPAAADAAKTTKVVPAAPATELDKLLRRFVDELVEIRPGTEPFPATLRTTLDLPSGQPPRELKLSDSFAISKYEMPQNLYQAVMGANPSRWQGPRNSVELMTIRDAERCCVRLTQLLRERELIAAEETIRLPTAVEWEYCCRAGTTTAYSFGDEIHRPGEPLGTHKRLDEYGWFTGNAAGNDPPVGALKPNPWGLYDMHGYLWEMTSTPVAMAGNVAKEPPEFWMCGGSWKDPAPALRSDSRKPLAATTKDDAIGFRCVRTRP